MLSSLLIATCLVVLSSAESNSLQWVPEPEPTIELEDAWGAFKIKYGKTFEDENEEIARKEIFAENLKTINENNDLYSKGLKTFTMEANQFADMNQSEFMNLMTGYIPPQNLSEVSTLPPDDGNVTWPKSVDWRKNGYVTKVKNQDGCCNYRRSNRGAKCSGYKEYTNLSEIRLKGRVAAVGPLSVSLDASQKSFHFYKSGVYYEPLCKKAIYRLNHAALVVGYGSYRGKDYWIVKNSWGTKWGKAGYIWMSRNKQNNCGIATDISYPVV